MDCSDYRRLLSRDIDGEIDTSQREALEEHLRDCAACRVARDSMRETFALHRGLGELEPPPSLMSGVMEGIVQPERRSVLAGLVRAAVPAAAAAVLLLGVYAGLSLTELYERPSAGERLSALELEYLDEYPPGSVGEFIMEVAEGGDDERRE